MPGLRDGKPDPFRQKHNLLSEPSIFELILYYYLLKSINYFSLHVGLYAQSRNILNSSSINNNTLIKKMCYFLINFNQVFLLESN